MACGEFGPGRMAEPPAIVAAIDAALGGGPLAGRHVLVTSGPTHEPIDPVRYIANRSSGPAGQRHRRGAGAARGARHLRHRPGRGAAAARAPRWSRSRPRAEMLAAVEAALPADAAVFAAAVADWRVVARERLEGEEGRRGRGRRRWRSAENPDILRTVAGRADGRPRLVVGFAAETDDVVANATAKRLRKGADWIVANDVSPATGIMGGTENAVTLITADGRRALAAHVQGGDRRARWPTASPRRWRDASRRDRAAARPRPGAAAAGLRHRGRRRHGRLRQPRAASTRAAA